MTGKASRLLFLFLLVFCPLAFGTVENWSYLVLEAGTGLACLLLVLSLLGEDKPPPAVPGLAPLFLLVGYMALHLLPLPVPLIRLLSPATHAIYQPLLDLDPEITSVTLSLNRGETLRQLLTTTAYSLMYFLTVQHCTRPDFQKRTISVVVTLGIVIAVEAILQKMTSDGTIYWFRSTPNGSPVGPWVYSNHFAGYMEMIFPLAIALFLSYRPRVDYECTLREKFLAILTLPGANRHLLLGTGAILMAVSILLSVSRGGIITLSIAFLFFVLFSSRVTADPRTRWAVILTVLVTLLTTWFGWEPIVRKFGNLWGENGLDTAGRLPVYQDTLQLVHTFPLVGSGFGSFIDLYPGVRTVTGDALFDHAHNDYLEILADGGIIAFVLCAWFIATVLVHSLRTLVRRHDRSAILIASGSLTGLLALLFHCLADFQIYNGANGLYFFFLCGLTVSAVNTRFHYRTTPTLLSRVSRRSLLLPFLLALLLFVGSTWHRTGLSAAERLISPLQSVFLNRHLPPGQLRHFREIAGQAASRDPLSPFYPYLMGTLSTFLDEGERAWKEYLEAALLRPASGIYVQQLGTALPPEQPLQAQRLLAQGLRYEPLVLERHLYAGDWYLRQHQREAGLRILNHALTTIPWRTTDTVRFMLQRGITSDELRATLPPLPAAWHEVGKRLERAEPDEAESFYRHALTLAESEGAAPDYFHRLYFLLLRLRKDDSALEVLRQGIDRLPEHAPFRILLGDYYRRQKIPYRAMEEYQQALRLDPGNGEVRRKLAQLNQEQGESTGGT